MQEDPAQLPPTEYYASEWERYEHLKAQLAQLMAADSPQIEMSTVCSQICEVLAILDGWTPENPTTYEQRRAKNSLRVVLEGMQQPPRRKGLPLRDQSKRFF